MNRSNRWFAGGVAAIPSGTYAPSLAGPTVVGPKPTGTVATDRANLLQAIGDTPAGGRLWLPGDPADPTARYSIDQALVVSKHLTIDTQACHEAYKSVTAGGGLNGPSAPYLLGAVIEQVTAATDILQLTGSGTSVDLRNLGLVFATAILHTNTGHGVYARPTQTLVAGGHDTGLVAFRWENVHVYGQDGNHYAFDLLNPLLGHIAHCYSHGGGGWNIGTDSFQGNFGNLTVEDTYAELFNAGTADGYRLYGRLAYPAATGVLNLCTFRRPQCNVTGAAATAGTQKAWNNTGGAAQPALVSITDPDMEIATGSASTIDFGGEGGGTIVRNAGGLLTKAPVGGFDTDRGYRLFAASGNLVIPNGVTRVRYRLIGAGGGGGGGGSASAVTNQTGGGGGGAGSVIEANMTVIPGSTYALTVGAGGTSGTAGTSGGNAGGAGGTGGTTIFNGINAVGGGGGAASGANTNGSANGGLFGRVGTIATVNIPGCGGVSQSPNGNGATLMPPGVVGGGAGGGGGASLGGGGGPAAAAATFPAFAAPSGGTGSASATAAGVVGVTPTAAGCGGGGGGGGAPTGAGGAGGVGAPGQIEVWW